MIREECHFSNTATKFLTLVTVLTLLRWTYNTNKKVYKLWKANREAVTLIPNN